jgi:glycyl-tRNA synthetase beta chain
MKGEILLEIGTEEIPAGFMAVAMESLADLMSKALDNARIQHDSLETYATPRRLIARVADADSMQQSKQIEKTGPSKSAAFDSDGRPTKAAIGFAKSLGVEVGDLTIVDTPKGQMTAIRKTESGRPTIQVLAEIFPEIIEKIAFPKTMRWMDLETRFARPVHWIVAIFQGQIIPFSFGRIESSDLSRGHRFVHPGSFKVASFQDLCETLGKDGIIVDQRERRSEIHRLIETMALSVGLEVFQDAELLDEVTFLVESPHPVMGEFQSDFLELPASILITCMKKHQRYFSLHGADGRITNKFVALNNTPVKDPQVCIKGHQRVLKARLEDARFYFREDRKTPLISRLEDLKGVVFHSKLGTVHEKINRFSELATEIAEQWEPGKVEDVKRAALLSKCDLETGIVYEFPELQGIIGSYYAGMDGEKKEVSKAVREHYLPAHAGDSLPTGEIGAIVSIADRIDTIAGCFSVGMVPTGASDPYALRRHALAIIQTLIHVQRPLDLKELIKSAVRKLDKFRTRPVEGLVEDILEFIRTRFVNFHVSRGLDLDCVEAVVRAGFDDIVDARRRSEAIQRWKRREDSDHIIIGFKRVVNILKDAKTPKFHKDRLVEPAEKKLYEVFQDIRDRSVPTINTGDYDRALSLIAELRSPIDGFFDGVMVMCEDEKLRNNRLGLLSKISEFFSLIADFSVIGSTAPAK